MKSANLNLANLAKLIEQNEDGTFSGGFAMLTPTKNALIIAGSEDPANNCGGTNCVQGCANNAVPGCGGTVNTAPRCGQ